MKTDRKMMSLRAITILSILVLVGCGPSRKEQAQERLKEAIKLKEEGNFNLAMLKLDSLIYYYSDQTDETEYAKEALRAINILEQERNLNYLDSMLLMQEELLAPMMRNFIISDEYGHEKILIHRRQRPENSYNRTFIRAHLNESGIFFISSRYHGNQWIQHRQIRVYIRDSSVLSELIPEDGFDNRRFEDGPSRWEIVNYKNGKDNGIIDFIATHWNEPLRVQFIGTKHEYIVMEQFDREAVRDAYEISFILKEVHRIKEERKKIVAALEKLYRSAAN
jgi:hypothetical protein